MSGQVTPTNQPITPLTHEDLSEAISKIKKKPNKSIPGGRRRRRKSIRKSRKSKRKRKRKSTKKKRRRRR